MRGRGYTGAGPSVREIEVVEPSKRKADVTGPSVREIEVVEPSKRKADVAGPSVVQEADVAGPSVVQETVEDEFGGMYTVEDSYEMKDAILHMRFSKYTDKEIMDCLGITEAQLNDYLVVTKIPIEMDMDFGVQTQESQPVEDDMEEEEDYDSEEEEAYEEDDSDSEEVHGEEEVHVEEEVEGEEEEVHGEEEEVQGVVEEVNGEDEEVQGVEEVHGEEEVVQGVVEEVQVQQVVVPKPVGRKRKISERITKLKLSKTKFDKYGTGSTTEKAYSVD